MASADPLHLGRKIAPVPFVVFGIVLFVAGAVLAPLLGIARGGMAAFDAAALAYFAAAAPVLRRRATDIRRTAADNDANRTLLLVLTGTVMLAILVAVYSELGGRSDKLAVALALATLVLAWLFSNTVYAFHYAHLFYMDGDDGRAAGGLDFPKQDTPEYWEFIYFSFTLGMTFQTSDVSIETTHMRKVVIGHCLAAFVFNLGVLAFTINVLGGG